LPITDTSVSVRPPFRGGSFHVKTVLNTRPNCRRLHRHRVARLRSKCCPRRDELGSLPDRKRRARCEAVRSSQLHPCNPGEVSVKWVIRTAITSVLVSTPARQVSLYRERRESRC